MSEIPGLDDNELDEVRRHLMNWGRWCRGEDGSVKSSAGIAWDELTAVLRELNRRHDNIPTFTREAELTARALIALAWQASKQRRALIHYHFHSTAARSIARAARVHHADVAVLLRHAHHNFTHLRQQISINPTPSLAFKALSRQDPRHA